MQRIMVTIKVLVIAVFMGFITVNHCYAAGTAAEAEALVKQAIEYIDAHGAEKTIAALNKKDGEFVKGDLYVFMFRVSEKEGQRVVCLAHPINPGLIGKDLYDLKDPSGNQFMAAMAKKAMNDNGGWVDYKWTHPETKKIEEKSSYALPAGTDIFVGCGIYK